MYGVSARTIERWIADARETIFEETRQRLRERIDLTGSQLDSVMRLVQTRFDLSVSRLLRR